MGQLILKLLCIVLDHISFLNLFRFCSLLSLLQSWWEICRREFVSSSVSYNFPICISFLGFLNFSPLSESLGPFISLGFYCIVTSATVIFFSFSQCNLSVALKVQFKCQLLPRAHVSYFPSLSMWDQ